MTYLGPTARRVLLRVLPPGPHPGFRGNVAGARQLQVGGGDGEDEGVDRHPGLRRRRGARRRPLRRRRPAARAGRLLGGHGDRLRGVCVCDQLPGPWPFNSRLIALCDRFISGSPYKTNRWHEDDLTAHGYLLNRRLTRDLRPDHSGSRAIPFRSYLEVHVKRRYGRRWC